MILSDLCYNYQDGIVEKYNAFFSYQKEAIMACRIGMTTNPGERKRHWESEHSNLSNWQILGRYKTKSEAQKAETAFANQQNCVSSPGGAGAEQDDWVVYKFEY